MTRRLLEHLNHELRSPMTVIVGMTDLLMMSAQGESARLLHSLKQAADAMLRMLDEAVDFSRLEAGSLPLERSPFAMASLTRQIAESLAGGPAPLRLNVAVGPEVPARLTGDAHRFGQVLEALTRTAAKLRASREYNLRISSEGLAAGILVRCALSEPKSGSGGPVSPGHSTSSAELKPLRLGDFEQGGYFGSGLGLPVAAGIAELMGGTLWISSDATSPLVFELTARFDLLGGPQENRFLAALEDRLASSAPKRALNLLLAEDTAANREFLRLVLEQRGHRVVAVANGKDALEAFESADPGQPFDVVLLDLEMPVLGGREAAAELTQLQRFAARRVPLIALTAHQIEGHPEFSSGGTFAAAVTKPCDMGYLFDLIEKLAAGDAPSELRRETEGPPTGGARIDYYGTLRRLGGSEKLFEDLRRFFLEDVPGIVAALGLALEGEDFEGIERGAHSLKGLVANFGANEATGLAGELQRLGNQRRLEEAAAVFQRLVEEVDLVRRELEHRE